MICSVSSNGLNKLVPSLIAKLESAEDDSANLRRTTHHRDRQSHTHAYGQ